MARVCSAQWGGINSEVTFVFLIYSFSLVEHFRDLYITASVLRTFSVHIRVRIFLEGD